MKKLFGTDGIRGKANISPMTAELAVRIGLAIGAVLPRKKQYPRVLIGKDTRISGYIFEAALTSGLCAMGIDVSYLGPIPTPAVAFLTESMRAELGIVISASHNPYMDNGIKFFTAKGFKLDDALEEEITRIVLDENTQWKYPEPDHIGKASRIVDAGGRYIVHLKNSFPKEISLEGVRIVLDCANGAGYKLAPLLFEELGATVIPIHVHPNGLNINEGCGSLHMDTIARAVLEYKADIGIALDGDADRVLVVDEKGTTLNGDNIMALCASYLLEKGTLYKNTLVATVQSTVALDTFMRERGGSVVRTNVGDRYVMEEIRTHGYTFGGEQSGHIIFADYSTTGDGLLASLQILRIMLEKQKPLSELASLLPESPQVMKNVKVQKKIPFDELPHVIELKKHIESQLGECGRVLLRYSGTENLCRVMIEGDDIHRITEYVEELASSIEKELGI
ncbi:MAG: phosphoglucosamine mutase [Desulfovibrionaceae bacterium]|nr:phosphoglucosamine mutase [Desulfovibrionaceae bacterium]